jgi:hypothetical protein
MGFLEEMIDLLQHTGNIKTIEDIKKEYGRANETYDYFIEIYYHYDMIKIIIYIMIMYISVVMNLMTF